MPSILKSRVNTIGSSAISFPRSKASAGRVAILAPSALPLPECKRDSVPCTRRRSLPSFLESEPALHVDQRDGRLLEPVSNRRHGRLMRLPPSRDVNFTTGTPCCRCFGLGWTPFEQWINRRRGFDISIPRFVVDQTAIVKPSGFDNADISAPARHLRRYCFDRTRGVVTR